MSNRNPNFPTDKILSLIPELTVRLEDDLHAVEPHFSRLGQNLQSVYSESSSLSEAIMLFANGMTDENRGSFKHDVQKIVDDALIVLSNCRSDLSGSLVNINSCTGTLQELCAICEKIQKCAVFLNVVGLNISVEGCRTSEIMEMFKDFGQEIKQLAGNIGKIAATISENSEKARKNQATVHTDIAGSMNTFEELSQSAKEAVEHAVKELTTISSLAASTLEKAGRHSQKISETVGEIVISIQSHDILRQQIEHIVSAMEDVSCILTNNMEDPEPLNASGKEDPALGKRRIQSILALQAAQLKHVVADIRDVYARMQHDFKNIGNEVNLLIENVAATDSGDTESPGLEEILQKFKSELEKLRELLAKGEILDEKIKTTMETSSQAVLTLSHHTERVTKINIDLQYKAINAIIMTNKLGDSGASLEVLARSVRDLSGELDGLVKNVLDNINAITSLADPPEPSAGSLPSPNGDISESVISLDKGLERISKAFELYNQSIMNSEKKAEKLMESIEKTGRGLDFLPGWIDGSTQVLEKLETLLEALSPWEAKGAELPAEIKNDIVQRYTMEKERKIHEQLTSAEGKNSSSALETDSSTGTDDLDDNIELF